MRSVLLLIVILGLSATFISSLNAQGIFKCEVNGVVTFSQTACDDQFQEIEVDVSSGTPENKLIKTQLQAQCLEVVISANPQIEPN